MDKIRTIIIDDELSARQTLRGFIEKFVPEIMIVAEADSIEAAVTVIENNEKDLVFLDIEMPYGSSFDILTQLEKIDFEIIFITAHDQYAIDAFKFSAIDYLLKPVKINELKAAVEKFKKRNFPKQSNEELVKVLIDNLNNTNHKLVLPTTNGFNIEKIENIIRCEADRNYTRFILVDGRKILVSKTLKEFDQLLSNQGFFRIHQSYLVNMNHITKYFKGQGGEIEMTDKAIIPVARTKKEMFLKLFR